MKENDLKNLISEVGQTHRFEKVKGGWIIARKECFIFLDLQKSKFGNYCDLNIKAFLQGVFRSYSREDWELRKNPGEVFIRPSEEYRDLFDLDSPLEEAERRSMMKSIFNEIILPFAEKVCSKDGLKELEKEGRIYLLPAVKKRLQMD